MPIGTLAGLVFGVAVLSIGLYHVAYVGPKFRTVVAALRGGAPLLEARAAVGAHTPNAPSAKAFEERLTLLEGTVKRDAHRVGFVRYNAFEDVGSDQSFTLALLNGDGDGVVLSSIYSREDTRTYGKSVRSFVAQQSASAEERDAIALARARPRIAR